MYIYIYIYIYIHTQTHTHIYNTLPQIHSVNILQVFIYFTYTFCIISYLSLYRIGPT